MKKTQRLDGLPEVVTKEVEVLTIVDPQFLTLTGKPANQVAFKIVRNDTEKDTPMTAPTRTRRVRPATRASLLTIDFPEGTTDEEIASIIEEYGLDGYELVTSACGGKKSLRRSDLTQDPTDAISVRLGDKMHAKIARSAPVAATTDIALPALSLIAIEFKNENFPSEASALEVITRLDIDILEKGIENTDSCIRVLRSEMQEDLDVRRVEVEPGVVAVIARADAMDMGTADVPFIEVVCETCYGCYGWGQLDFAAAMADEEYCDASREAIYIFDDVVRQILFYSELPIAIRKELVSRAAGQLSTYIGSLLDALPTKVVMINRSQVDKKEKEMSAKTEAAGAVAQPVVAETQITRAEIGEMITAAVTAAMAAAAPVVAEPVIRAEPVVEAPAEEKTVAEDGKVLEAVGVVTRSVSEVAESLRAVVERLAKIEGTTVARSDGADTNVAAPQKDVFAGVFSGKTSA